MAGRRSKRELLPTWGNSIQEPLHAGQREQAGLQRAQPERHPGALLWLQRNR